VLTVSSITYTQTNCSAKNGTFAALQMLQRQEVDVIFGPTCSTGKLQLLKLLLLIIIIIIIIHEFHRDASLETKHQGRYYYY